jgi:hypothetical protein
MPLPQIELPAETTRTPIRPINSCSTSSEHLSEDWRRAPPKRVTLSLAADEIILAGGIGLKR